MTRLRLKLFGGFEARQPSGQPVVFSRKRAQALLAYLALQPGAAHPRAKLAGLLWNGVTAERARHGLRQVLVSLRQGLAAAPAPVLVDDGESVSVDPAALEVDVLAFERLVAQGEPQSLVQAAALYDGELLAGLELGDTPFDSWLLARRERVREDAIRSLGRLMEKQRANGRHEEAIVTAARLLALDPTQEAVHRALMQLYSGRGRRGAALRQYEACLAALERELGVTPEDETRLLFRELLRDRNAAAQRRPPVGRAVRQPAAARTAPLIGRDTERSLLHGILERCSGGASACAAILGEGGIGKTRLVEAMVEDAERAGMLTLLGRTWESERNLPFAPWVHAFREAAGVLPGLAADLDAGARRELARLFPELGPAPDDAPAEDHLRLFAAVAQALRRLTDQGPLLVAIEDLHWADEMSARLLRYLAHACAALPIALVATARPAEASRAPQVERALEELARQARGTRIALPPLSRADTLAVVAAMVRVGTDRDAVRDLGEKAYRLGRGSPFLAVEAVRAARDTGAIGGQPPDATEAGDVVAGRLDRLDGIGAELAAAASVIGREFGVELLARTASLGLEEATEGIAELVERRVLHTAGERLDFVHDHLRDAAYARLPELHRRMLHGAAARALEELHATDLGPHQLALGRHCLESARWERAFGHLREAGLRAVARSAHREAVTSFEQALAAASRLPPQPQRTRLMIDIGFALRGSLTLLGDLPGTLQCLRSAEPHARALGDPELEAWVAIFTGSCLSLMGRHAEALDAGERVRVQGASGGAGGVEPYWPAIVLGASRYFVGDYAQAEAQLGPAAILAAGDAGYRRRGVIGHPAVVSHTFRALGLAETGDFDAALGAAAAALELSERLDSPWDTGHACFAAGLARLRRGDFAQGIEPLRRGVELTRQRDLPMGVRILTPVLGAGLAAAGEIDEAMALLAPVMAAPLLPMCLVFVGEAYLLAGRTEEAAGVASRALAHSAERGEHGARGWAEWLLGCIAQRRGEADAALLHYRRALELAEPRRMRPLVAHCHLGIGELLAKQGRSAEAQIALDQAGRLYGEMKMTHWRGRALGGRHAAGMRRADA